MGNYSMPGYFQSMQVLKGSPFAPNAENVAELKGIEADLHEQVAKMLSAGVPDDKIHAKGQYTAMERILSLVDEGSFCPLNTLYNPADNKDEKIGIVGTSLVKGLGRINGKWAVIIASDNKKMAGAWVAGQADNLLRGSDTAKMLGIPLVYILNCSGVKLDEQEKVYAGRVTGGTPFYRHAELEQLGIPVLVGIYGTTPAGGGYHSISPTILIAHEKANMAVGGAGIVGGMKPKGYIDQEAAEEIIKNTVNAGKIDPPGAVNVHFAKTGFFREVYSGEEGVIAALKKYMDAMPAYNENFYRVADPMEPAFDAEDLYTNLNANQKQFYEVRNILGCLFDNSEFMEFKKGYGPEIVCGLAKVNGLLTGVVTNHQGLIPNYPEYPSQGGPIGVGGKLYRQGLMKMNEFVTLCARDRLPIVWLQDTTGIDVGNPAEEAELLGLGQSLIYSIQNADVPQMEVTMRKGTAAAHYVMGGPQGTGRNIFSLGTAATEIYVMHGETAATAMYSRRLVKDQKDGKDLQPTIDKMNALIQDYAAKSNPRACAEQGLVDEIVKLSDLRNYIAAFVGAAYQNPKSICPFHHMILPRNIREWNSLRK